MTALIVVLSVATIAGLARVNLTNGGRRGWLRLIGDVVCLSLPSVGAVTTLPPSINMQVLLAYLVVALLLTEIRNLRFHGGNKTTHERWPASAEANGTVRGGPGTRIRCRIDRVIRGSARAGTGSARDPDRRKGVCPLGRDGNRFQV
ncbi:MAG: hypothetical protein Q8P61_00440 [Candidatus Nanopelagicales bacterium]|nr:hypothetical protein [Candidatus Nanopelagicales bacterium]